MALTDVYSMPRATQIATGQARSHCFVTLPTTASTAFGGFARSIERYFRDASTWTTPPYRRPAAAAAAAAAAVVVAAVLLGVAFLCACMKRSIRLRVEEKMSYS